HRRAVYHEDVQALLDDLLHISHHRRVLDGVYASHHPCLPHGVGVDVAALQGRHHLLRLHVDHRVVRRVELELVDHGQPEDLAAGAAGHAHLLALELIQIVDVAADHRDPAHQPRGLRDPHHGGIDAVVAA